MKYIGLVFVLFSLGFLAVEGYEHIISRVRRIIGGTPLGDEEAPYLTFVAGFDSRRRRSIFSLLSPGRETTTASTTTTSTTTTTAISLSEEPVSYCTGSLIDKRWALTAAHCFDGKTTNGVSLKDPSLWSVKIGTVTLKESRGRTWLNKIKARWFKTVETPSGKFVGVESIIIHPGYNAENPSLKDDIAVVRLKEDVELGSNVQNVQLNQDTSFPPDWSLCKAQGWGCTSTGGGRSNVARSVTLPIFDSSICAEGFDLKYNICAGYYDRNKGICPGDSGGPLLCKRDGEWIQVGVAYLSSALDPGNNPAIYARVSTYLDWIKGQTGITP